MTVFTEGRLPSPARIRSTIAAVTDPPPDLKDVALVHKALADPTRLRIMHYLANETLSPADLARRLRLRAPTVTHHLKTLRLAGLVRVTMGKEKDARQYAARLEAVTAACDALQDFLLRGAAPEDE